MYGGADGTSSTSYAEATRNEKDSNAKKLVDAWYVTNILNTGYSKYLSDEIFCSDRSVLGPSVTGSPSDTGIGYGLNPVWFGGHYRFFKNGSKANVLPTFKCPQKNDSFTLKDNYSLEVTRSTVDGNKSLKYPVGLMTMDEIYAAGSGYGVNCYDFYIYKNSGYPVMSMTPSYVKSDVVSVFSHFGSMTHHSPTTVSVSYAPVINIAPQYALKLLGSGTRTSPYYLPI